jgi:hypothetical protein
MIYRTIELCHPEIYLHEEEDGEEKELDHHVVYAATR